MKRAVDQQIIRETNQYLILNTVLNNRWVTRAFLAQTLQLSPPSISHNVENLIQRDLLVEKSTDDRDNGKLGRRGIVLEFNKQQFYIMAVDLSTAHLQIGICDMYQNMIACDRLDRLEDCEAGTVYQMVTAAIDGAMKRYGIDRAFIKAIVVATPGIINQVTGEMQCIPQFPGWERLNLKELLSEQYRGIKILVENDINAVAIGESRFGIGMENPNFFHLNIDLGVGGSLILNGKLHTGSHFASGEVAFMVTHPDQLGQTGPEGPLESVISIPRIRRNIARALEMDRHQVTIDFINQGYARNDPAVLQEADRVSRHLAMLIINVMALLDVELVVIGGEFTRLEIGLLDRINRLVEGMTPFRPDIRYSDQSSYSCMKGAFSIGVEEVLRILVANQ